MPDTCEIVKKRCLKYIANRVGYLKERKIKSYREESITDELIYRIETGSCSDSKILHANNESKLGADIEWWLFDKKLQRAIALRIQAKKMDNDGVYNGINRNIGNASDKDPMARKQINVLLKASIADKMIPLYCFYNYLGGINSSKRVWDYSWTYSLANFVKKAITKTSGLPIKEAPRNIKIKPSNITLMNSILDLLCNCNSTYLSDLLIKRFVDYENKYYYKKNFLKYEDFIKNESEIPIEITKYVTKNQIDDFNLIYTNAKYTNAKYIIITNRDNVIDPKLIDKNRPPYNN
ncbi:DUF6615 family protein [Bacillus toyonensis]|uniref:DUF6615 family protein n=1 Tax=Bacillus toyonensis TaxID=155322 RepID=UPI001CD3E7C9|nr:DUF6615 family protein [Bacillus toyonensis]MCA1047048.1 hypothetical protein [Bacillus toyonensis]